MSTVKKCSSIIFLAIFLGTSSLWSYGYFSGLFGTSTQLESSADAPYINVFSHNFLSTQINFANFIYLRSSLYFDITTKKEQPTDFGIDTLSLTFRILAPRSLSYHYISLLYKEDEPFGSGIFFQRHFGIESLDSPIMVSNRNIFGNGIFNYVDDSYRSAGISYTVRFDEPLLLGTYFTGSYDEYNTKAGFDFRFAGVWNTFVMDFSFGANAIFGHKNIDGTSKDNAFSFDSLAIKTGVSMVIGDRNAMSVYLQAGISDFNVYSANSDIIKLFSFEKLYFVFEPRFHFEAPLAEFPFKLNFTMYSIPIELSKKMVYIDNPFGVTATFIFDAINVYGLEVGIFFTVSSESTTFKKLDYMLAESVKIKIYNGVLDLALKLRLEELLNISRGYELSVGYRFSL